jgi:cobalt-zinc-cadmium efflux system outer membrane protein
MKIVAAMLALTALPAVAQQAMPDMSISPSSSSSQHAQQVTASAQGPDLLAETEGRSPLPLEELLTVARGQNPTLRAARARMAQSAGQATQAGLLPNPVVGYQGEQIRGGSFGGGEQGGFVEQTIPLGGKLGLRRQAYRAQERTGELGVREQEERIAGEVESRFYAALALQQEIELRRHLGEVAGDAALTAKQLANVGQADAPDVLQAEVEAEQAGLDTMRTERQYISAFHQLAAAAGQPDLALTRLSGTLEGPPPAINAAKGESPAVQRADAAVAVAEARLRSARRDMVPDLTLRAGEQWNGELVRERPNVPVGAQSFASASIDLPLWNRNQGNIATAEAALEQARAVAAGTRLAFAQAEAPLEQQYRIAAAEVQRYRTELLPRAQHAYELYRDRYEQMAAAYPQVLVSQRTLFQLQVDYVRALGELWQDAALLRHFTLNGALNAPAD